MARRAGNEKLTWLREHFPDGAGEATADENTPGENTPGEPPLAGDVPSRPCRYCPGTVYLRM
jgi:hypothetical protein